MTKKKRIKLIILGISLYSMNSASQAGKIEIDQDNLFVPHMVAKQARLSYDTDQNLFTAVIDGKTKKINNYDVSGIPENASEEQIVSFLKFGYFSLHQADEDLILKAHLKLLGGSGRGSNSGAKAGAVAGAAAGAYTGAAIGAAGGPVGAAVGGVVGGVVGGAVGGSIGNAGDKRAAQKK